jgi:hypothetical protein
VSEAFAQAGIGRPAPVEVVVEALPTTPPALPPVEEEERVSSCICCSGPVCRDEFDLWYVQFHKIETGEIPASPEMRAIVSDFHNYEISFEDAIIRARKL